MQIENINFGHKVFDTFYENEELFVKMFKKSKAYRFCVKEVFCELVRLGVYGRISKMKEQSIWADVVTEEKKLFSSINHHEECCIAILVIFHLAELRLNKTN